jgi:hypothetical protein
VDTREALAVSGAAIQRANQFLCDLETLQTLFGAIDPKRNRNELDNQIDMQPLRVKAGWESFKRIDRPRKVRIRFGIGENSRSGIAGALRVFERFRVVATLREMMGELGGKFIRPNVIQAFERYADGKVQAPAFVPEQ